MCLLNEIIESQRTSKLWLTCIVSVQTKMAGVNVRVSVEAIQEHQIQEVTLDGQEIYVP